MKVTQNVVRTSGLLLRELRKEIIKLPQGNANNTPPEPPRAQGYAQGYASASNPYRDMVTALDDACETLMTLMVHR